MSWLRKGLFVAAGLLALGTALFTPILPARDAYAFRSLPNGKCEVRQEDRQTPFSYLSKLIAQPTDYDERLVRIKDGGVGYQIAPGWVLTADHVVDEYVERGGLTVLYDKGEEITELHDDNGDGDDDRLDRIYKGATPIEGTVRALDRRNDLALVALTSSRDLPNVTFGIPKNKDLTVRTFDVHPPYKRIRNNDGEITTTYEVNEINVPVERVGILRREDQSDKLRLGNATTYGDVDKYVTDDRVGPGTSGSPVLDKGRITGVVSWGDHLGHFFSPTSSEIIDFLRESCTQN